MRRTSLAPIFLGAALIFGPAHADDADDLAEIVRLQARLRASVPATLRVFSAGFGSGITLQLRGPGSAPQQAWIGSGSDWVELTSSGYIGTDCLDAGIAIAEFSPEAGMRAYYKARAFAQEQQANVLTPRDLRFAFEGDRCEPGWRTSLRVNENHLIYLTFGIDGLLARVTHLRHDEWDHLDAASVRAIDQRLSAALPFARAEAEPLPAEAMFIEPAGEEYLVASIGGRAYVCADDDIHFLYDYYRVELKCEGDATTDPLMVGVAAVEPGKSSHRMVAGMPGPALWTRQGLVELESDTDLRDTRVWIDALDTKLIEGRFEGTVTNASGKRVKIAGGRFRLLPGEGFRVTPP